MEKQNQKKNKKIVIGIVVSEKMDKTITIEMEFHKRHPLYKKFVKRHKKIKAHDEQNKAKKGDTVKIIETRPISKDKCWKLLEIL